MTSPCQSFNPNDMTNEYYWILIKHPRVQANDEDTVKIKSKNQTF